MYIAIAFVVGLMAGIGLAFYWSIMDNTMKDDQDVESYLGLPVLGSIQKFPKTHTKGKKNSIIPKVGSETIES